MKGRYLLMIAALVVLCRGEPHGETASSSSQLAGCVATEQQLSQAVNQSMGGTFREIVVNCLAYQDAQRTVELAVVSGYAADSTASRFTVECRSGLLVIEESTLNATNETVACHECIAASSVQLCADSNKCANGCASCYGPAQNQCLACGIARSNGVCVSQCPNMQSPNPDRGNECECEPYRVLPDCECERECENKLLNTETCQCEDCPSDHVYLVINVTGPVPTSVRGYPPTEFHEVTEQQCADVHHEKRRRAEQHGGEGGKETPVEEPTMCVSINECQNSLPNGRAHIGSNRCYACGLEYCLNCTTETSCTKCREGTLLTGPVNDKICEGFYHVIEERLLELECEELEEDNARDDELLHLKIILPIVCIGTLIVFLGLAVIAHFRYPHVGENKRHRKPNKKTDVPEHERPWRPQATVRLR